MVGGAERFVQIYDIASDTWDSLPSLPAPRWGSGLVEMDDALYVIGGVTEKTSRSNSEGQERRFARQMRRTTTESQLVPIQSHALPISDSGSGEIAPGSWADWWADRDAKRPAVVAFAS